MKPLIYVQCAPILYQMQYAVGCANVTGSTKERVAQHKRSRSGFIVDID